MQPRAGELKENCSEDCLSVPWQIGAVALYLRQCSGLYNLALAITISVAEIITRSIELGESVIGKFWTCWCPLKTVKIKKRLERVAKEKIYLP